MSAKVSVPNRHAGVKQVIMTLTFSLFEIRRSAIMKPLNCSPRVRSGLCSSMYLSPVFPSPNTAPPRYLNLFLQLDMSSSSLWWPMCSTSVVSRLSVSPCLVSNQCHSSSVAPVCHIPPGPGCLHMKEFLHGILHRRLPADEVQYCYEQQRAQHAALPQSNLDLKLLRCSFPQHHSCCCRVHASTILTSASGTPIHRSDAIPPLWYCVESFFQVDEPKSHILLCTSSIFSTICRRSYIRSTVPLPFMNPCCSSQKSRLLFS